MRDRRIDGVALLQPDIAVGAGGQRADRHGGLQITPRHDPAQALGQQRTGGKETDLVVLLECLLHRLSPGRCR